MINIEREKAKRKIIALLNKTADRGATEQEALTAAEKAAELMAFYDIEAGELELKEKNIVKETVTAKTYLHRGYLNSTTMGIAKMCQCRTWKNTGTKQFTFFGFKHDVEVAVALLNYLQEAAQRAVEDFVESEDFMRLISRGTIRLRLVSSFIMGFDHRLYQKLTELAHEREQKVILSTGTSLVPLKAAELDNELRSQGVRLCTRRSSGARDFSAAQLGRQAADNTQINPMINGSSTARRVSCDA